MPLVGPKKFYIFINHRFAFLRPCFEFVQCEKNEFFLGYRFEAGTIRLRRCALSPLGYAPLRLRAPWASGPFGFRLLGQNNFPHRLIWKLNLKLGHLNWCVRYWTACPLPTPSLHSDKLYFFQFLCKKMGGNYTSKQAVFWVTIGSQYMITIRLIRKSYSIKWFTS